MLKINPEKTFTPSLKHYLRYVHPDDIERVKNTVQTALKERSRISNRISNTSKRSNNQS